MIRQVVARIAGNTLTALKAALGIESPARVWSARIWDALCVDGKRWPPEVPVPWYAAREPLDAYSSPECRSAARRVRRLIRRHWYALAFEPNSPTACAVRAAMETPPKQADHSAFDDACVAMQRLDEFRRLLSAGEIEIDLTAIDDFADRCGIQLDGATSSHGAPFAVDAWPNEDERDLR
jgi:hypothetical protein